ncbi:MAG: hypothetical protein GY820_22285 [Gammaproteobacteria bacterium]|nr:hypothetical protein [Gammaproteobacteria bacterium]
MKITTVKGWCELDEDRSFTIGPCHAGDIAEALAIEHSCDSSACDVCHALEAGFPVVAADLFSSGIESLLLAAIDRAHRFHRTALPPGHFESEWQLWLRYQGEEREEGRIWQCLACDVFNWDSDACGACSAERPVWRLTHAAYCGMVNVLETDIELAPIRSAAAHAIRDARQRGFEVAVREAGAHWEILEPDDSVLVPDECGEISLELSA